MKSATRSIVFGSLLALSVHIAGAQQATTADSVILLDQAWSKEDREWYYNFSQGSAVLSYDLFLNIEAADSQDLFRNGLSEPRYGLVPAARQPIQSGRVADRRQQDQRCDGNQRLAGRRLRRHDLCGLPRRATEVQGQAHSYRRRHLEHVRFPGFGFRASTRRLQANLTDAAKFDRLAARLGASTPDAKDKLRKRIESEKARVHEYATRTSVTPHPWGPGRVDALTMIVDRTTATLSGIRRELVDGNCAGQASVPLECSAGIVDAVGRLCAGSDWPQFWRDHGRLPAR